MNRLGPRTFEKKILDFYLAPFHFSFALFSSLTPTLCGYRSPDLHYSIILAARPTIIITMRETARRSASTSNLYSSGEEEEACLERALWDGVFWLEARKAMVRSVEWFQLGTIVEGVREEAFRAGIWLANPSLRSDGYS
jgi:hypothetical protein